MAESLKYRRRTTAAKPRSKRLQQIIRQTALDVAGYGELINEEIAQIKSLWKVDADGNLITTMNLKIAGTITMPTTTQKPDGTIVEGWAIVSGDDFVKLVN